MVYELRQESFKSGILRLEEEWHDGRRQGFSRLYHTRGNLREEGKYRFGKKDGTWEKFSITNVRIEEVAWKDGRHDGSERKWVDPFCDSDPILVEEKEWDNDSATIVHKKWDWKTRKLVEECPYKNGKKHGKFIQATKDGFVYKVSEYFNGLQHGECKSWNRDTRIPEWEQHWEHGQKHKTWREFHENGKVHKVSHYYLDKSFGVWKVKTDGGVVLSETQYRNGRRHGWCREWHNAKGYKKAREMFYQHGKIHGPILTWHWTGQLESEMPYIKNIRHGLTFRVDIAGVLREMVVHRKGKEVGLDKFEDWHQWYEDQRQIILIRWMQRHVRWKAGRPDGPVLMKSIYYNIDGVWPDSDNALLWMAERRQSDTEREERRWCEYKRSAGTEDPVDHKTFIHDHRHRQWAAKMANRRAQQGDKWNEEYEWLEHIEKQTKETKEFEQRWAAYQAKLERKRSVSPPIESKSGRKRSASPLIESKPKRTKI